MHSSVFQTNVVATKNKRKLDDYEAEVDYHKNNHGFYLPDAFMLISFLPTCSPATMENFPFSCRRQNGLQIWHRAESSIRNYHSHLFHRLIHNIVVATIIHKTRWYRLCLQSLMLHRTIDLPHPRTIHHPNHNWKQNCRCSSNSLLWCRTPIWAIHLALTKNLAICQLLPNTPTAIAWKEGGAKSYTDKIRTLGKKQKKKKLLLLAPSQKTTNFEWRL